MSLFVLAVSSLKWYEWVDKVAMADITWSDLGIDMEKFTSSPLGNYIIQVLQNFSSKTKAEELQELVKGFRRKVPVFDDSLFNAFWDNFDKWGLPGTATPIDLFINCVYFSLAIIPEERDTKELAKDYGKEGLATMKAFSEAIPMFKDLVKLLGLDYDEIVKVLNKVAKEGNVRVVDIAKCVHLDIDFILGWSQSVRYFMDGNITVGDLIDTIFDLDIAPLDPAYLAAAKVMNSTKEIDFFSVGEALEPLVKFVFKVPKKAEMLVLKFVSLVFSTLSGFLAKPSVNDRLDIILRACELDVKKVTKALADKVSWLDEESIAGVYNQDVVDAVAEYTRQIKDGKFKPLELMYGDDKTSIEGIRNISTALTNFFDGKASMLAVYDAMMDYGIAAWDEEESEEEYEDERPVNELIAVRQVMKTLASATTSFREAMELLADVGADFFDTVDLIFKSGTTFDDVFDLVGGNLTEVQRGFEEVIDTVLGWKDTKLSEVWLEIDPEQEILQIMKDIDYYVINANTASTSFHNVLKALGTLLNKVNDLADKVFKMIGLSTSTIPVKFVHDTLSTVAESFQARDFSALSLVKSVASTFYIEDAVEIAYSAFDVILKYQDKTFSEAVKALNVLPLKAWESFAALKGYSLVGKTIEEVVGKLVYSGKGTTTIRHLIQVSEWYKELKGMTSDKTAMHAVAKALLVPVDDFYDMFSWFSKYVQPTTESTLTYDNLLSILPKELRKQLASLFSAISSTFSNDKLDVPTLKDIVDTIDDLDESIAFILDHDGLPDWAIAVIVVAAVVVVAIVIIAIVCVIRKKRSSDVISI